MSFDINDLRKIYRRKVLNQELSLREFEEKKLVLQSRPSKAIVELTENCNFRCLMCSQAFDPKYQRYHSDLNMKLELFDKVAEALFHDAYFVDLRGFGESVILPHWPDIVDRLEHYPFVNWHLVTNLSLPRDGVWERMMKCGFVLGISWDAATQETFEGIRVRSHFNTLLHNLELVSQNIKSNGCGFIYFIVTVQRRNVAELPAIIELAARYSVPEVQFKIVRKFDSYVQHDEMIRPEQRQELSESITRSLRVAVERGVRLTINDTELHAGLDKSMIDQASSVAYPEPVLAFPPRKDFDPEFDQEHEWSRLAAAVGDTARVSVHQRCFKPYHYTYVAKDGRVGTCNHMMNPDIFEMGNLSHQSFAEIWNGDDYQVFRKGLVNRRPMDLRCQWCFKHRLED